MCVALFLIRGYLSEVWVDTPQPPQGQTYRAAPGTRLVTRHSVNDTAVLSNS